MGRSPCCDESGLKKGPWTPEEDDKLIKHIQKHGHGSWRALPKLAGRLLLIPPSTPSRHILPGLVEFSNECVYVCGIYRS